MHPAFSNGFLIEIQYTAIVFNRAQRAPVEVFSMHPAFSNGFLIGDSIHCYFFFPVEVFSMHPAFSNGFLIEIQYTAIVFNRAQRAPASHGWFSTNAVPEILILVPFLGGGAPPINKVLGLVYYIVCYIVVYIYIHIYIVYIVFYCQAGAPALAPACDPGAARPEAKSKP